MKLLVTKGRTSLLVKLFIQDSSSAVGAGLTGLVFNSAGLTCYRARDDDGNAAGVVQALVSATRGTWTSIGFVEKDATNMPGVYEFGVPDAALATGSETAVFEFRGAANMAPLVLEIQLTSFDVQLAALNAAGIRSAVGLASANLDAQLATIAGYIDTEVAAILAAVDTEVASIKTQTDKLTFTVANQVDANVLDWKSSVAPAMTGDAFARLGAPAGASVSADIAAVKALLPAALVGGRMDSSVGAMANNTLTASAIAAGAIQAVSFAANALDANALATDAVTEIVNAVWANASRTLTDKANFTLTAGERNSISDALLDRADGIETGMTLRQAQRLISAVLLGKTSGAPAAPVFRDVNDTANRVSATIAGGNRTAVTLTP